MAVPPNPHFDLIKMLLGEGGHRLNARPSAGMREYAHRRDFDLGSIPESGSNVVPGPGSNRPPSQDEWFEQLMGQAESAGKAKAPSGSPPGEYFVWVTNKSGKRIRLAGPFNDAREAQKEMDRLAKSSPKVSLSVGTADLE